MIGNKGFTSEAELRGGTLEGVVSAAVTLGMD